MRSLRYLGLAAFVMGVFCLGGSSASRAADDKVKLTIKEVMKLVHNKKTGLLYKAKDGTITPDEKKQLVEAYTALAANKPPKGDAESWKKFTSDIVAAAKEYGAGKDEKAAKLEKAAACMTCHKAHRGS